MERQKLLTIEDLAEYLNISKKTIQNRISLKTFQIPFIKVGGMVRFKPSEVEKFLERNTIKC